jgi:hypothetical protein
MKIIIILTALIHIIPIEIRGDGCFMSPITGASVALDNLAAGGAIFLVDPPAEPKLAPVEGTFVQVLGRPLDSNGQFQEAISSNNQTIFGMEVPGYFNGGLSKRISGVASSCRAEFIVRAWRGAETWSEALEDPTAFAGQSEVFENETGYYSDVTTPDFKARNLNNPPVFMRPVPEPSTAFLILTGGGALVLTVSFRNRRVATLIILTVLVYTIPIQARADACVSSPTIGASIQLDNLASGGAIFLVDPPAEPELAPVEGTFVQVLGRPLNSGGEFQEAISSNNETIFGMEVPGYFNGCLSKRVPGVAAICHAEFIVRAWRGADTWAEALEDPSAFVGQSEVFENETGTYRDVTTPDFNPRPLNNPPVFMRPVPEPSTAFFVLTGGVTLLLAGLFRNGRVIISKNQ